MSQELRVTVNQDTGAARSVTDKEHYEMMIQPEYNHVRNFFLSPEDLDDDELVHVLHVDPQDLRPEHTQQYIDRCFRVYLSRFHIVRCTPASLPCSPAA